MMRKHSSVLMLMIRSSFGKILGLLALMAVVQVGLLWWGMEQLSYYDYGLEQAISQGYIAVSTGVFFVLMTLLLCSVGCDRNGKTSYTLQRLSVSERTVYLWQTVYNTGCYFLFWCAQLFIALGLCHLYMEMADPARVTNQTIFLAFYRNAFLHSLLPLADTSRWIRNLFLLIAMGVSSAAYPYRQRRGKGGTGLLVMSCLTMLMFVSETGNEEMDTFLISVCVGLMAWAACLVFERKDDDEG